MRSDRIEARAQSSEAMAEEEGADGRGAASVDERPEPPETSVGRGNGKNGANGGNNWAALLSVMKQVLRGVRPGKSVRYDTAVPSKMLLPRSGLEVMEDMYYAGEMQNGLSSIGMQATPEGRMLALVRWYLHTVTAPPYLRKPYNPVLGETHVFQAQDGYMMEEQVSHHPPVTAFYGEDLSGNTKYWGQYEPHATFTGVGILIRMTGKSSVQVRENELYEMPQVGLHIRLLPPLGAEWVGKVRIRCEATGLCTAFEFKPRGILPGGSWNVVTGRIYRSLPSHGNNNRKREEVLLQFKGSWMGQVVATYNNYAGYPAEGEVIVDGKYKHGVNPDIGPKFTDVLNKNDEKSSYAVWRKLTLALYDGDDVASGKEKHRVEQYERKIRKWRKESGIEFCPRFFEATDGHAATGEKITMWKLRSHELSAYLRSVGGGVWPFHCPCCELYKFRPSEASCTLRSHPLLGLPEEEDDDAPSSKAASSPLRMFKKLGRGKKKKKPGLVAGSEDQESAGLTNKEKKLGLKGSKSSSGKQ